MSYCVSRTLLGMRLTMTGFNVNISVIQGEPDIAKLRDFDKSWIDTNDVGHVHNKNRPLKQH